MGGWIHEDAVPSAVAFRREFSSRHNKYRGARGFNYNYMKSKLVPLPWYAVWAGAGVVAIWHDEWGLWLAARPTTENQKREWGLITAKITPSLVEFDTLQCLRPKLHRNLSLDKIVGDDLRLAVALAPALDRLCADA